MYPSTLFRSLLMLCFLLTAWVSSAQKTLNVRISSADDDLEEWLPARAGQTQSKTVGALDAGSSDIEFGTEASGNDPQLAGLRFNNLSIPKGAIILEAYIQFTVDAINKNTDPCKITLKTEWTGNSAAFNPRTNFDLSSRSKSTDSVLWTVSGSTWGTVGASTADQRTPNLSLLVQKIIDRKDWNQGNSVSFFLNGTGTREVESYDGDAPKAAMLVITYISPVTLSTRINSADDDMEEWTKPRNGQTQSKIQGALDAGSSDLELGTEASGNDPQTVGIRFTNINIPKGSLIRNAYIQFTVDATNKNSDPCVLQIKPEMSDSASAYNASINQHISSRTLGKDSATWTVAGSSWSTVGAATEEQRTPDISQLVQSMIDQTKWKTGNPLAFQIYGSGTREVESYDGDAPKAPLLVIDYIPVKTLAVRINAAEDDIEEWIPARAGQTQAKTVGALDLGSSDLELGTEGAGNDPQIVAVRFNNINLEKNAIIRKAYIQFTVDATNKNTDPCELVIKSENSDTPKFFNANEAFNVSKRPVSSDSVKWTVTGSSWATVGAATEEQRTADISQLIQNKVNQVNWFNGNSLAFFITGKGTREVESYDGDAPKAPLLVIETLGGEGGPVVKPAIPVSSYPITKKSNWTYHDSGIALIQNWNSNSNKAYNSWSFGKAPLGFGELGFTSTDINGGPSNNRFPTVYFKKPFLISNLSNLSDTLELQLMCDDGAVVYINGTEAVRRSLPAGNVQYKTKASKRSEAPFERVYWLYYVPKTLFKADTNTISVEIHQYDSLSSDLLFDLALNNRKYKANAPAISCGNGNSGHISCFTSVMPTEQTDTIVLPSSHKYEAILKTGDAYSLTGTVPSNFDFTGYIPENGNSKKGWVALNHEKNPGGVSILHVHYNCISGKWDLDSVFPVDFGGPLVKTSSNCSGGVTPWGTSVTCEEDAPLGDANSDGYQDIGWMIEIDPKTHKVKQYGNGKAEKLWAMGRMSHENVCFKNDSLTAYYGEDETDGNVWKFVADKKTDLSKGKLYVLKLSADLDSKGDPTVATGTWELVPNNTTGERNFTKDYAKLISATKFNGVEDVEIHPITGEIYFTAKGVGRTYKFKDNGTSVSNFITFVGGETYPINFGDGVIAEDWGGGNDNLDFDDKGNLWVLQDGGRNHVWMVRPEHTQTNPQIELFMVTPSGSEPTGISFTPDHKYMFISIQEPAGTLAQKDVNGKDIVFNKSHALVVSRAENFKPFNVPKPVITGQTNVNKTNTYNYSASGSKGSTFNWTLSNGTQLSGGNSSLITVKWNNASTGQVSVSEKINQQCQSDAGSINVVISNTDISNLEKIAGLKVYPNPGESTLNILANEDLIFSIYDINGSEVMSGQQIATQPESLDISQLSAGIYLIRISNDKESVIIQFVKY